MFKRRTRRSPNILFGIFRLLLSLAMFGVLLVGILSAYKHFSGTDPLKISPKSLTDMAMQLIPQLGSRFIPQLSQKVLGKKIEPPQEEYKLNTTIPAQTPSPKPVKTEAKFIFRFMLVADSHNDNTNLKKAIDQAKKDYGDPSGIKDVKFIVGLGDYTDVGTVGELQEAKKVLDSSSLRYFVTAGDHDLWDSRNRSLSPAQDFNSVFGPAYQSFTLDNFKFIMVYDADNYVGVDDKQRSWLASELNVGNSSQGTFIFLHEPLFHPSSDHFMGRVEPNLKSQAQNLINQLSQARVKKVFAGDTHYFSEYEEPQTKLSMVTVGAITSQRNLQNPRFAIVSVYDDGSTSVEDVEIK